MKYRLEYASSVEKELRKIPKKDQSRIAKALDLLMQDPYGEILQIKKLKGSDRAFRIRVGDYRILYEIYREHLLVLVIAVRARKDAYR